MGTTPRLLYWHFLFVQVGRDDNHNRITKYWADSFAEKWIKKYNLRAKNNESTKHRHTTNKY